ncbi:hypothetical protein OXYTRIMIC_100 [Oxytricha trifallax]|uniref:Uncharacterized protein n=1 Tax=Oxytricha trifallax TaxID=1172189 RepID=A0A073HYP7_9SPIT|nr:hypothetical protein OXYTRIMIC_100 [Oxytricha trifallax]
MNKDRLVRICNFYEWIRNRRFFTTCENIMESRKATLHTIKINSKIYKWEHHMKTITNNYNNQAHIIWIELVISQIHKLNSTLTQLQQQVWLLADLQLSTLDIKMYYSLSQKTN